MSIFTLDIETMKHPNRDIQIPVLVTIAHLMNGETNTVAIIINQEYLKRNGDIDGAIMDM